MAETSDIADVRAALPEQRAATPYGAHIDIGVDEPLLAVTDNLQRDAFIGQAALDAIERYMSDILDEVLGMPAPADTNCRPTVKRRITS